MTATGEVFKAIPEVFEIALPRVRQHGWWRALSREADAHRSETSRHVATGILMAKPRLVALRELTARILEDGRFAIQRLRSPNEHLRSLGQAFAAIPNELGLDPGVGFRVIVDGRPNELRPVVRDELYRIGCEAIVNAYRHSRAKNIEMLIEFRPAQLRIAVRDDGCGIDPRQLKCPQHGCWGLHGMRERAGQIGGRVRVFTRVELGTELELCVHGQLAYEQFGRVNNRGDHA